MKFILSLLFVCALIFGAIAVWSVSAIVSELINSNGPAQALFSAGRSFVLRPGMRRPGFGASAPMSMGQVERLINDASAKHGVPAAFVRSIVAAESNFDSTAVSPKGAIGLMQLMPETAQLFGADPNVPDRNVDAGTRYLRVLLDRYSRYRNPLPRVIAAYNAAPKSVDRYRGVPPFPETRTYVARVLRFLREFDGAPRYTGDGALATALLPRIPRRW